MGEIEINSNNHTITISSHIITYGNEATEEVTERMRKEIETMWNEPNAFIYLHNNHYRIFFRITSEIKKDISELEILQNDPSIPAGMKGGTMHPMFRKVRQKDIEELKLHKLRFINNKALIGELTNVYHWNHEERSTDV